MRRILTNLSLAFAAVLVTLSFLEIALRLVGYNPVGVALEASDLGNVDAVLRPSANPELRYELVPNSSGVAWGTEVTINSHGMRDREYSLGKPAGRFRVAVLGDSKTFGNSLAIEDVYTEVLERRLAEDDRAVEVLNFGVGGYDTVQEVALLETRVVAFDVDLVVVGYCMNDVGQVSANIEYIQNLQKYGSAIYRLRVVQFVVRQIERIALTWEMERANEVEAFAANFAGRIDAIDDDQALLAMIDRLSELLQTGGQRHQTLGWYTAHERVGRLRYTLRRISELGREHGFHVVLVIFPYLGSHEDVHRIAYDIVRYEAKRQGFDVVEVVDQFVDAGIDGLRISENDLVHPNEAGHAIIANALFDYLTGRPEVGVPRPVRPRLRPGR